MWSIEQVESVAPSPSVMTAARPIATPTRWAHLGVEADALWGSFRGSGAEPYDVAVDHRRGAFRCTCPSRKVPCKHALALLLLWIGGHVPDGAAPPMVAAWMARRVPRAGEPAPVDDAGDPEPVTGEPGTSTEPAAGSTVDDPDPPPPGDRIEGRDERVARMYEGLDELDRWLVDRMRTGLADPSLAQYSTWDSLAARLVDARAGSLANRIRRLAGLVGAAPDWHERVLEEIGLLHLLSQAGRRLATLPDDLADRVATAVGWQVRQADVLAGVPETDDWLVAGRSDTREDRIEVRRVWLRGATSGRWALILSFAAYRQSLDTSLAVGSVIHADLHRYPGHALRALLGDTTPDVAVPKNVGIGPVSGPIPTFFGTVEAGVEEVGRMIADEPWVDRVPMLVAAAPTIVRGRWVLTDNTGSIPIADSDVPAVAGLATLLALSGGGPVDLAVEWTPTGIVPLTVFTARGAVDIGPRADPSFVGAA